jgi:hypothetical protein
MDMETFFELGLIAVESFGSVLVLSIVLLDEGLDYSERFALSLDEGKDMIDVIGNNVSFLSEGILLCCFWHWIYRICDMLKT